MPNQIDVKIAGQTWPTTYCKHFEEQNFAVLSYEGPDFSPPVIANLNEMFAPQHIASVTKNGTFLSKFEIETDNGGPKTASLRGLPKNWKQGGVAFKDWGTISGLVSRNSTLISMAIIAQALRKEKDTFITQATPTAQPLNEVVQTINKNLVCVSIKRSPNPDKPQRAFLNTLFETNGKLQSQPLLWKVEDKSKISGITDQGIVSSARKSDLPGLLGSAMSIGFVQLESGKYKWSREQFIVISTSHLGTSYVIEPMTKWDKFKNSTRAILHHDYSVESYDEANRVVTITHKINIKPEKDVAIRLSAVETIKFDLRKGLVVESSLIGKLTSNLPEALDEIDVKMDVRLLSIDQAQVHASSLETNSETIDETADFGIFAQKSARRL